MKDMTFARPSISHSTDADTSLFLFFESQKETANTGMFSHMVGMIIEAQPIVNNTIVLKGFGFAE